MKILIACEESQRICMAFREKGHEAYSCDIMECSGGHPEWHIQQDAIPLINGNCQFKTNDGQMHQIIGQWDLLIAHPPCTYLTVAANAYYNVEKYGEKALERLKLREEAVKFFMLFTKAKCDHIAIENPVGIMSTRYQKPTQIIQPYWFGDPYSKKTCLWLKNLPPLEKTNEVEPIKEGKNKSYSGPFFYVKDERGKALRYNDKRTSIIRSKTFLGIAQAIADQWGDYFENCQT